MAIFTNTCMQEESNKTKRKKTPWPTRDAMRQIYETNLWGGKGSGFYSGDGSHFSHLVDPYIEVLISFLMAFDEPLTVCDLGCGDFNIGEKLAPFTKKYIAVDIVEDLIKHHKKKYKEGHIVFYCLDIAEDNVPAGDCAIVRQVLQHLSNAEVKKIVKKLMSYKYVVLTEHIPEGNFVPNMDIISGQGIRLKKQSGLDLLAPPFDFEVKDVQQLLSIPLEDGKGMIITAVYTIY